jgi:hypothetical protein
MYVLKIKIGEGFTNFFFSRNKFIMVKKGVVRRRDWLRYEDEFMIDMRAYYPTHRKCCGAIQKHLQKRSLKEVKLRMSILMKNKKEKSDLTKIVNTHYVTFFPQNLDRVPLLPFLKICSYLDAETVFCTLSLVCQHFNIMLRDNKIPIFDVSLDRSKMPVIKLSTLVRRVTNINQITILREIYPVLGPLWNLNIERLITTVFQPHGALVLHTTFNSGLVELFNKRADLKNVDIQLTLMREEIPPAIEGVFKPKIFTAMGKKKMSLFILKCTNPSNEVHKKWRLIGDPFFGRSSFFKTIILLRLMQYRGFGKPQEPIRGRELYPHPPILNMSYN